MAELIVIIYCDLDGTFILDNSMGLQWSSLGWRRKILILTKSLGKKWKMKLLLTDETREKTFQPRISSKVVDYLDIARNNGSQIVLATAAESKFAESLAGKYFTFDRYLGTKHSWHNKGKKKAMAIIEDSANKEFVYIGDSLSDFSIWQYATKAISVKDNFSIRMMSRIKGVPLCIL